MRENGSLMKDDDTRRLEVLSTEGRLFGKRECALLPRWIPNHPENDTRKRPWRSSPGMRAAVRHTWIDDPSAGVGREKQEQKGRTKLSRPMHIVCDNAEPTPHAGIAS